MAQRSGRTKRKADRYVRPPLFAHEPPSRPAAAWRFRLVALIIVAALALVVLYIARHLINTEQNPTFGTLPAHATVHSVTA
ncbi:MAG: hypothetical protein ACJ735_17285 [Actinomycetes bacterium]